jgi:flavin reductase (DIM6/NTAB) family NADH-FMN oxidoreductase RutF
MEITPSDLSIHEMYKLITGTIVPRAIGWVSTVNGEGQPNLAPFSYFTAVCAKPPTILFCPGIRGRDVSMKDTLRNIRGNGEFVVNIVTEELAQAMNITATELPAEVNEFELAGVTAGPSYIVKAPRVVESPVNYECRVTEIVDIGDGSKGSGSVVIGEVVHLHVADEIMQPNYHIDIHALKAIGRLAGPNYAYIKETFAMVRPPSQVQPKEG